MIVGTDVKFGNSPFTVDVGVKEVLLRRRELDTEIHRHLPTSEKGSVPSREERGRTRSTSNRQTEHLRPVSLRSRRQKSSAQPLRSSELDPTTDEGEVRTDFDALVQTRLKGQPHARRRLLVLIRLLRSHDLHRLSWEGTSSRRTVNGIPSSVANAPPISSMNILCER